MHLCVSVSHGLGDLGRHRHRHATALLESRLQTGDIFLCSGRSRPDNQQLRSSRLRCRLLLPCGRQCCRQLLSCRCLRRGSSPALLLKGISGRLLLVKQLLVKAL